MVGDGSTDKPVARAKQLQPDHPQQSLRIIRQSNSGKASALNTGLKHATGELILCVDADSKIAPDALKWGTRHFADDSVAAVAGQIRVANQQHWLTKFQQLEYIISQNFVRRALSWYGIVSVIPGPTGLFRRNVILELGGYNEDKELFAEDADLTVRLLAKGWKVVSEDRMIAKTEAPEGIYPLLRQRYRWKRGIYQTLHANFKNLIFSPRKREPFIALLLLLEGFVMEIISFAITVFILASFIRFGELKLLYMWFGLLFSLDILVLMTSIGKDWWKSIPLLLAQKLLYGHALQVWNALALFDEWRSTKMSWDKVDRVGALSS
jgi:cellulose synthase/poly-beta-1,6-N-acetylglucosamine synthase-like glycosyltransferase